MQKQNLKTNIKPLLVKEGFLLSEDMQDRPLKRGVSLFWSQWGSSFWRQGVIKSLIANWSPDFIRIPIGSHEDDLGYITDEDSAVEKAIEVIDEALSHDVYVIVDCHDHEALSHSLNASLLLTKIASKYGDHPGILYEVVNEPLHVTWEEIKVYAEFVISGIRRYAPNAICLVGTPEWCTELHNAFTAPVNLPNVMYTYHFYAATHKKEYRDDLDFFLQRGMPIFVSECGATENTGDGITDFREFDKWLDLLDTKYKVPWCAWSLMDKGEASSMLIEGADGNSLDRIDSFTDYGLFMLGRVKSPIPEDKHWAPYRKGYLSRFPSALDERDAVATLMSHTVQIPKKLLVAFTRATLFDLNEESTALYTVWIAQSWGKIDHGTRREIMGNLVDRYKEELTKDSTPGNLWALRRLVDSVILLEKGQKIA